MTFDRRNPETWNEALPDGYEWRRSHGPEWHLFDPDGIDVTQEFYDTQKLLYQQGKDNDSESVQRGVRKATGKGPRGLRRSRG